MAQIAIVLSAVAAIGFVLIGAAALVNPAVLSHLYGTYVHEPNGRAFVRAAGARDAAFGLLLAILIVLVPIAVQITLSIGALIAVADLIIVIKANKTFERGPLLGHIAGFVFLTLTATFVGMANLSR